jgi:hypothetical protein
MAPDDIRRDTRVDLRNLSAKKIPVTVMACCASIRVNGSHSPPAPGRRNSTSLLSARRLHLEPSVSEKACDRSFAWMSVLAPVATLTR